VKIGYANLPTYGATNTTGSTQKTDKTADTTKSSSVDASQTAEDVSVSSEARSLAARGSNGFDHARVERLRSARSGGELSLDSASVAKRLEEEN
jgi:flagellar biosynthesis anti-sigma factor FlgM